MPKNIELSGNMFLRLTSRELHEYLETFKKDKTFHYLFYDTCDNTGFHLFGLEYTRLIEDDYLFRIVDPKVWMLTKIKYGI